MDGKNKKLNAPKAKPAAKATTQTKKTSKPATKTTTNKNKTDKKETTPVTTTATSSTAPAQIETKQEPKPLTEEEIKQHKAATRIQTKWRGFMAKRQLKRLKVEKAELDEKLSKLEQDAFLEAIRLEQERDEKRRLKKLKEEQERKRREQRKKKFLDAAYDGNLQEMKFLINDLEKELNEQDAGKIDAAKRKRILLSLIDSKDANGNSALSEAAAGGSAEVVTFLLSKNADPNSRGAFGRTPLWRASFAGHLNCVQLLLENGADPRLYSQDGQRCQDAATKDNVVDLLKNWNIKLTDRMLEQIDRSKRELKQQEIDSIKERKRNAERDYQKVNGQFETVKNELYKCNCELQRLNDEYLLKPDMYGPLIEKKENEKVELTLKYESLRERSVKTRIAFKELLYEFRQEKRQLNEQQQQKQPPLSDESDEEDSSDEATLDDRKLMKINIREMDDMILRDLSDAIKNSLDRWPLIIDQNEQAATFLRYRDTNYVNCLDMQSMQTSRFRLALIGAIRYGKPFVLDLMQYDRELLESVRVVCDQIDPQLFELMCNKKLLQNEYFLKLVKLQTDGKEYESHNFSQTRINNFKLLFLTSNPYPDEKLLKLTMPIKVIATGIANKDDF